MTLRIKIALFIALICSIAHAQTQIYRSLQVNKTAAIATNALGSLTISGSTATFSAAMPDSMGVGDAIVYNATLSICFIHGRTSSTVYTVKSASGGTPTAIVTDVGWNAYRAYTALSSWESRTENTGIPVGVRDFDSGTTRNLVSNNEVWNVACYRSSNDEATVSTGASDWVTDATRYVRWYTPYAATEVGTTQRHTGKEVQPYFRVNSLLAISTGGADVVRCWRFEGLVWRMEAVNCQNFSVADASSGSDIQFEDCVFYGRNGSGCSGTTAGISASTDFNGTIKIKNTIFYNFDGSGNNSGAGSHAAIYFISSAASTGTIYAYNVTDFNSNYSFKHEEPQGVFYVKNCVSNDSDTKGYFTAGGAAFHTDSNYNLSDRAADAPGANSKNSRNVAFVSEGSNDFHLASTDTTAGNSGVDLSADANLAVTTDIDRESRPTTYVDMGADEGVASPAASGGLSSKKRYFKRKDP